jgi:hypothetical protein
MAEIVMSFYKDVLSHSEYTGAEIEQTLELLWHL